jgi:GTPase SAR1 family protein
MPKDFEFDVFLSYNSADKPRVRSLAERLKGVGLRVWFDEWCIKAGESIYLAVEHGLEAARVQVLCLSTAALGSNWVKMERSTVLFRDPDNAGRRFIPLLLADCELPDTLRSYKYLDFREDGEAAFDELLASCGIESQRSPAAPELKTTKERAKKRTKRQAKTKTGPKVAPEQSEPLAVLERKLTGHSGWVNSVAFSPDGKRAASGADDNAVKIWDIESGQCQATLKGHTDFVMSVVFTRDGQSLASGSDDKTVRIWSLAEETESRVCRGHTNCVRGLGTLPDEQTIVSLGCDNKLIFWEITTARISQTLPVPGEMAWPLAVSRDGRHACIGQYRGKAIILNLETGELLATLSGHSGITRSVEITPDGRFAASGSEDTTVKIWDVGSGSCVGTLEGHGSKVYSVAVSPDGTMAASAGYRDRTVRLWDWKSGSCLQVITLDSAHEPTSVAFDCTGSRLVVGTAKGEIHVYRLAGIRPARPVEAPRRYVNAKVVLIGEGTVGKTSLAHRLVEDRYVVRDRTHGMNVSRLDLPLPPDAAIEREALLWDLAGQEDYRLIHQLFLDETALALLLINPQKDDPFSEAGDWLKALKTAVAGAEAKRDAARLLIFSQIDVGGMKLGNAKIDRFREQHGFAGWLATSAKTGENCSDQENSGQPSKLKQLIAESIPWEKLPWTSTPRLLAELKNAVVAMRDESDIRLLRFAELAQRLEQALPGERFVESDVRTAVKLLANHGLARPLEFGDLVLLRPDLLNGYAGAIIRAARAHTDEIGCVLETQIYKPSFDFTGVERLKHRADEELLLRAMVQTLLDHSLCIAEETPHGRHLVFPSQYRREKDIPRDPDIFVSYTFSGEWQTVWTTLVVRLWYSQEFEHRELWRNAAEFASAKGHTLGLLIKKDGDGDATISLYFDVEVPDELKVLFIEYVHRHLAKYGFSVRRDRRYVCPECAKPVIDHEEVRNRLAASKTFIYCQKCDAKVPLTDFIEQRLKSDPVAQKILAMDATATRELDAQALEQILIGHMMAIAGEANQVFRLGALAEHGIDGEVEFKDNDGKLSGKKIYVQLKSADYYGRTRKADESEVFDPKDERQLEFWSSRPVDVYLVIRQMDEMSGDATIRWMNVTRYLRNRKDNKNRQIIFDGEKLDMEAVWKVRDELFPPVRGKR